MSGRRGTPRRAAAAARAVRYGVAQWWRTRAKTPSRAGRGGLYSAWRIARRTSTAGASLALLLSLPSTAPLAAQVVKTVADRYAGTLSVLRVVSGTLRPDSSLLNATRGSKERVGKLLLLRGAEHVDVPEAGPGDVVVCLGAGDITAWARALPAELEALKGETVG